MHIFPSAGMEKEKQCTSRWEDLVYLGEVSALVGLAPCVMSILCYNENELTVNMISAEVLLLTLYYLNTHVAVTQADSSREQSLHLKKTIGFQLIKNDQIESRI